jgi:hypothetical protein
MKAAAAIDDRFRPSLDLRDRTAQEKDDIAVHRGADAETLKRWKEAEGPEMDDAFGRLAAEGEAQSSDRLPVRQRHEEDDIRVRPLSFARNRLGSFARLCSRECTARTSRS